jgi:hypothetical protein
MIRGLFDLESLPPSEANVEKEEIHENKEHLSVGRHPARRGGFGLSGPCAANEEREDRRH